MVKKKKAPAKKSSAAKKKASNSHVHKFIICPYTNQKVFIQRATLKDLKAKSTYANTGKRLWLLASPAQRNEIFLKAAGAIASVEQELLPSFGGRSWEVTCKLSDNPLTLFRAYKGQMELATLPHLMEKIPEPPTWPGRRKSTPEEYFENDDEDCRELQEREISTLSSVAWDLRSTKYPVPQVTLKWKSPDYQTFTSRKGAWEYATQMAQREVFIDKHILGIGASGKLLQPTFPSAPTTLKVGKLRFERDGLWVVGQELGWQEDRPELLLEQEQDEDNTEKKKRPPSGLTMYIDANRESYRQQHDDCKTLQQAASELRKVWKTLSDEEHREWNKKAGVDTPPKKPKAEKPKTKKDADSKAKKNAKKTKDDKKTTTVKKRTMTVSTFYINSRRHEYLQEKRLTYASNYTMSSAITDLREMWKTLSDLDKATWSEKLDEYERQLEQEKQKAEAEKIENSKVEQVESTPLTEKTIDNAKVPMGEVQPKALEFEEEKKEDENSEKEHDGKPSSAAPEAASMSRNDNEKVTMKKTSQDVPSSESAAATQEPSSSKPLSEPSTPVVGQIPSATDIGLISTASSAAPNKKDCEPQRVSSNSEPLKPIKSTGSKAAKKPAKKPVSIPQPTSRVTQRWCLNKDQIDLCYSACMEHYEQVMRTVKARDLTRELQDGFDVLRERGRGRFDMELPAFDAPVFEFLNDLNKAPWMPVVRTILGDDVILIHKGCFLSMPGAEKQEYHQDGVHLTTQTQRPCHAINVFVPLVDLTNRNGPTEFCLGSQVLGHEDYDRDFVETPTPKAGTPVIFDYRLGHRGMGNASTSCRPVVYCTYARASDGKAFRDSVNFSRRRYHRIGELVEKPLSREERRNKRKRSVESNQEKEELSKVLDLSIQEAPNAAGNMATDATKSCKEDSSNLHENAIAMAIQTHCS